MFAVPCGPLRVNSWIVPLTDTTCIVVDPAADSAWGDADALSARLRQLKLQPVAAVLTHGHFDHVAGLSAFHAQYAAAPVLIHMADSDCIGADGRKIQARTLHLMGIGHLASAFENMPPATAFLEDGHTLAEYVPAADSETSGALLQWHIVHTPGHSPGSVCLHNAARKVLVSGDTVFFRSWGRTDLPGGNEAQLQKSLRRIYSEIDADTIVYPGHEHYGFALSENM